MAAVAEVGRGLSAALGALLASPAVAQAIELRVAVAGANALAGAPAIAWLLGDHLPQRPEWPAGLAPGAPLHLTLRPDGLQIRAAGVPLPDGAIAAGSCRVQGQEAWFRCAADGTEDWFVPADFPLPANLRRLLTALPRPALDAPHTIATPVLVGHLAGSLATGDPRADLLQLGSSHCGDLTWVAWRRGDLLRVRGRSGGGLTLPAWLAAIAGGDRQLPPTLLLQAFAAREGDRDEAARRLWQNDATGEPVLRALLHADDPTTLAAIDALVRRHSCSALPAIVAAAGPDRPWATQAAADALRLLWPDADTATRQATRTALARSDSIALRSVDPEAWSATPRQLVPAAGDEVGNRVRALAWLGCIAACLYGLWARERHWRLRRD